MTASRKQNQKGTITRDTSTTNSTFVRPTAPGSNQEEAKKEDETKTESRPTGRVDHPTTKYDYIEQLEEEEKKKEEEQNQSQERPTGRIDHPTTKYDYIEQLGEEVQVKNVADNSDVVIEYTLKVVSAGPNAAKVMELVLGSSRRRRNINPNTSFSCTLQQDKAKEAFEMAHKAVELGAEVEFKKRISIEVTII